MGQQGTTKNFLKVAKNSFFLLLANSVTQAEVCAEVQKFQDSNPAIKQDGRSITVESKEGQRLENYDYLQNHLKKGNLN